MVTKDAIIAAARQILELSKADQTEVTLFSSDKALSRFAQNTLHQNVETRDTVAVIRMAVGHKVYTANTNRLEEADIKEFLGQMLQATKLQPENPDFESLPATTINGHYEAFDAETAAFDGAGRAGIIKEVLGRVQENGFTGSGLLANRQEIFCTANTLGNCSTFTSTAAHFSVTAAAGTATGYVKSYARSIRELGIAAQTGRAIEKALLNQNPRTIEPGRYTVILEEEPMAELMLYLAHLAFGAQSVIENRSFLKEKAGTQVAPSTISLYDDCNHPRHLGAPFDYEGMPKQRVDFLRRGVACGPVTDSLTAKKLALPNTGHAPIGAGPEGPYPRDLVLEEGNLPVSELVGSTKKGILITRLWYNRVVDIKRTVLTGMTRDGTFLIEDGKVVAALKNLRYNESILKVLERTTGLTRERWLQKENGVRVVTPHLRSEDFLFTGQSDV